MSEDIEVHQIAKVNASKWICCFDCGLLITPKTNQKKEWSICSTCAAVYEIGSQHPWIAKMLALHIGGVLPRKKKLALFRCSHCQNYYLATGANRQCGPVCYWCKVRGYAKAKDHASERCHVCNRSMAKRFLPSGLCQDCLNGIDKVKKSLEYVYYIFGKGRTYRRA